MKNILISIILAASLIACKKENKDIKLDSNIYFTGITKTDINGFLHSNPDTTDWRFDDIWTTKEENLFSDNNINSKQKFLTYISLYPNPNTGTFHVDLNNKPNSSILAIRFVNKNFQILYKNDSLFRSELFFNISTLIDTSTFVSFDTLRIYYKLIDSQKYEYRGHGDILITKW